MKGRKLTRLLAILVAALMAVTMITSYSAKAANYSGMTNDSLKTMKLNKKLVIEKSCDVPAVECTFTISINEVQEIAEDTTNNKYAIKKGIMTGLADTATISFTQQTKAEAKSAADSDSTDDFEYTEPDADHYTLAKATTIDFSNVVFPEPGIYRYKIAENVNNAAVNRDTPKFLDVYVEDATNGATKMLKVINFQLLNCEATVAPTNDGNNSKYPDSTKVDGFTNTYPTTMLTFGKEVVGNQASRDKYFKFTLAVTDSVAGSVFLVDVSNADATIAANPNPATTCITAEVTNPTNLTVGTDGKVSADFYLQDGQYITVYGLTDDSKYTISEDAEDYTKAEKISATNSSLNYKGDADCDELEDEVSGTIDVDTKTAIYTGFTNTKTGVIPTGVILKATGLIIVGLIVIIGVVFFGVRSKRRYEED